MKRVVVVFLLLSGNALAQWDTRSLIGESERIVSEQRQQEYRESQERQRLNDQEQARMQRQMELDRQQWDRIYDRGERGYRR